MLSHGKTKTLKVCGRVVVEQLTSLLSGGAGAAEAWEADTGGIGGNLDTTKSWLLEPGLHVALAGDDLLAFARGTKLVLASSGNGHGGRSNPLSVQLELGEGEKISAIEWLVFESSNGRFARDGKHRGGGGGHLGGIVGCIMVGTTSGYFHTLSDTGKLLLKQQMHAGAIVRIRVRGGGGSSQGMRTFPDDAGQDVSLIYHDGIVCLNAAELQFVLFRKLAALEKGKELGQWWAGKGSEYEGERGGVSTGGISYRKWSFGKNMASCVDGAVTGRQQPSLFEIQASKAEVLVLAVGSEPPIALFSAPEDKNSSFSPVKIASKVVSKVGSAVSYAFHASSFLWRAGGDRSMPTTPRASTLSSNTSGAWGEGGGVNPERLSSLLAKQESQRQAKGGQGEERTGKEGALGPGMPVNVKASLKDPPRRAESLALSPNGSLAAVADGLGRILLLDLAVPAIIRMWKGYRDAHCSFLIVPVSRQLGDSSEESGPGVRERGGGLGSSESKHPTNQPRNDVTCLCLAIYAPRRGVVEVWRLRHGPRVVAVRCGTNCRLLIPSTRLQPSRVPIISGNPLSPHMMGASMSAPTSPKASASVLRNARGFGGDGSVLGAGAFSVGTRNDSSRGRAFLLHGNGGQVTEIIVSPSIGFGDGGGSSLQKEVKGSMSESDILQRLCDLLRHRPGSLLAARAAVEYLDADSPSIRVGNVAGIFEGMDREWFPGERGEAEDEEQEHIVIRLMSALESPRRRLQALDMLIATRPSMRARFRLAATQLAKSAVRKWLDNADSRCAAAAPVSKAVTVATDHEFDKHQVPQLEEASLPDSKRNRPPSRELIRKSQDGPEHAGGGLKGVEPPKEGGYLLGVEEASQRGMGGKLRRKMGVLLWHEHLLELFIILGGDMFDDEREDSDGEWRVSGGLWRIKAGKEGTNRRAVPELFDDVRSWVRSEEQSRDSRAARAGSGKSGHLLRPPVQRADRHVHHKKSEHPKMLDRNWSALLSGSAPGRSGRKPLTQGLVPSRPALTCREFIRSFIFDPTLAPPCIPRRKSAMVPTNVGSLRLLREGDLGTTAGMIPTASIGSLIFRWMLRGGAGAARVVVGLEGLPLPGSDWERLFLGWYDLAPLDGIVALPARMLVDVLRWIAKSVSETETAGGFEPGGRFAGSYQWCRRSGESSKGLILARCCQFVVEEMMERRGLEGLLSGEAESAKQWGETAERTTDVWWIERVVRKVSVCAEERGWVGGLSSLIPTVAELPSFAVASWAARLQLLVSLSADASMSMQRVPAIQPSVLRTRRESLTEGGSDDGREGGEQEKLVELFQVLSGRFPGSCHDDILAVHRGLELCRQWKGGRLSARTSEAMGAAVAAIGGDGNEDLLLIAQEHFSCISSVALKGGIASSVWASQVGPRAAAVVSLVQRLKRGPTDEECAQARGVVGSSAEAVAEVVSAYEQLSVLLYDCVLLAEGTPSVGGADMDAHDQFLAAKDSTCRDAIADFRLRPPRLELVGDFRLLLRTVGTAISLHVNPADVSAMFPPELLSIFPALFMQYPVPAARGDGSSQAQAYGLVSSTALEARMEFLLGVLAAQRALSSRGDKKGFRGGSHMGGGGRYVGISAYALANDLGVDHVLLRRKQHTLQKTVVRSSSRQRGPSARKSANLL